MIELESGWVRNCVKRSNGGGNGGEIRSFMELVTVMVV